MAVNDAVVPSAVLGRMVELEWAVGGEVLASQPCDGLICSTPSGSTAYNLSNGGPVLMWGIDAMAVTFVAPHSLHARPLVVPRGRDLDRLEPDARRRRRRRSSTGTVSPKPARRARADPARADRSLLATLPEATFVRRYRHGFAS